MHEMETKPETNGRKKWYPRAGELRELLCPGVGVFKRSQRIAISSVEKHKSF